MATHSSILARRIPGTEEPSGLPSMGSHRVGHDWSDLAAYPPIPSPGSERTTCPRFLCHLIPDCLANESHWWETERLGKNPGYFWVVSSWSCAAVSLQFPLHSSCLGGPSSGQEFSQVSNSCQRGLTHCFLQLNFLKSRSSLLPLLSSGLLAGLHLSQCNQVHVPVSNTLRAKDLQGFLFLLLFYSASI